MSSGTVTRTKKRVNPSRAVARRDSFPGRGQAWRNIIDAAVASARARTRVRGVDHATPPRLMLGAAEAIRAIVTRIGPTERGWALASVASELERTALMRLARPTPT
jgi:hypothetical protein